MRHIDFQNQMVKGCRIRFKSDYKSSKLIFLGFNDKHGACINCRFLESKECKGVMICELNGEKVEECGKSLIGNTFIKEVENINIEEVTGISFMDESDFVI